MQARATANFAVVSLANTPEATVPTIKIWNLCMILLPVFNNPCIRVTCGTTAWLVRILYSRALYHLVVVM